MRDGDEEQQRRPVGSARSEASDAEVVTPLRGLGSVVRFQRGAVIFPEHDQGPGQNGEFPLAGISM